MHQLPVPAPISDARREIVVWRINSLQRQWRDESPGFRHQLVILFPSDGGKKWHIVFLLDLFFGQVDILLRIRYGPVLNYGNVKPGKFYRRRNWSNRNNAEGFGFSNQRVDWRKYTYSPQRQKAVKVDDASRCRKSVRKTVWLVSYRLSWLLLSKTWPSYWDSVVLLAQLLF